MNNSIPMLKATDEHRNELLIVDSQHSALLDRRVAVVIPLEPPNEFQPHESLHGWTLLQRSLVTSQDDEGKFVAAVRQIESRPVWRFLTPDKTMNWSRGLDDKNSISESFRLFPDEAAGLAATRQYPATRLYKLNLDAEGERMLLIHVGDYAIPGFGVNE